MLRWPEIVKKGMSSTDAVDYRIAAVTFVTNVVLVSI